jgi:putative ABC transport system ATP-binding protein
MIRLRGLRKAYKVGKNTNAILQDINLDLAKGEFVAVMGQSGAGKTTLINILAMLDSDWQGEYSLAGQAVQTLADPARKKLARDHLSLIFQQYHLLDDLTVAENIALPLQYRDAPRSEIKNRVDELLQRFGLDAMRDYMPRMLSGGQQQMVAVARALVTRPALLLADEPTGALHSEQGAMIMQTLKAIHADGTGILLITHNAENAAMAGRTITIRDGRIEE